MKNKILLVIVFASFGFSVYLFFTNIKKAKSLICYYEGTELGTANTGNNTWKNNSSFAKKNTASQDKPAEYSMNLKSKDKQIWADSRITGFSINPQNGEYETKIKDKTQVDTNIATSSILLIQSYNLKNEKSSKNDITILSESPYSKNVLNSHATFIGISTATDNNIIMAHGGDRASNTQISLEDLIGILFTLIMFYAVSKFHKNTILIHPHQHS